MMSDPASAAVAFSAERSDDACVAFVVVTENATAAEACSRCRPEGAALVTAAIVMVEGASRLPEGYLARFLSSSLIIII